MTPPEGRADTVVAYLDRIERAAFDEAAALFTEDAEYYHPPEFQDEVHATGRDAIREYFETRGPQDVDHEILKTVETDDAAALVGEFTGEPIEDTYFVSYAEFDGALISFYIAGVLH